MNPMNWLQLVKMYPALRVTQPRDGEHRFRAYEGIGLVGEF
jgi:hypothetical protein